MDSQSDSSKMNSAASDPEILWGDSTDSLKQFADHDGRKNNYKDYIITTQVEMNGKITQELSIANVVGSDFLTDLQKINIVKQRPIPPENETKVTLTVSDKGILYQYILYEGGNIYTIQNERTYYLGNSTLEFWWQLSRFRVAALYTIASEQAEVPELPKFDPWNYQISSDIEGGASKHKTDFTPDKFDVIVIETDYENLFTPVLVRNTAAKAKILDYLNKATQNEEIGMVVSGAGPIIRVFNKTECFNYLLRGDQLIDYQNELVYALPDGLYDCIEESVVYELVCLLEEK